MALTGIQIFKLLPKTNCKECGVPTCLAFAMNLASGKAELDSCPYVSDEAKEQLAEASAPPIRPVKIGKGVRAFTTGGETVQYRHEKTFYNHTTLAAMVGSDISDADLTAKLTTWNAFQFERVGLNLRPELVALKDANGDAAAFDTAAILDNGPNARKHIIVSFSSDYIRVYIDGTEVSSSGSNDGDMSGVTQSDFATANNLYVGAMNFQNSGDLYHFDGKIDNFQVHTSAISSVSSYGYSSVIGLSERLRDDVASGNKVYISSSTGVNILSSAVSVDDL